MGQHRAAQRVAVPAVPLAACRRSRVAERSESGCIVGGRADGQIDRQGEPRMAGGSGVPTAELHHRTKCGAFSSRLAGQVVVGVATIVLLTTDLASAQLNRMAADAVPPMNGATLEGTVLDETDVAIDDLGNTRLDLLPNAKQPESLPPDLEDRLDALSEVREAMAETVEEDAAPLLVPALNDPDAPPRMDERVRDPDRLGRAAESATADGPIPAYNPERPVDAPSEDSSAADGAAATITE